MALVEFEKTGRVGKIILNDEKNLNAMSVAMGQEFKKLLAKIAKDKDLSVVILSGAGRAFSSGGNLDMILGLMTMPQKTIVKNLKTFYKMFLAIRNLPQIVIAAINGHAVGAGFCLALGCDLKYAATTAKMGANFAKLGLAPGMAGTYLITHLAGLVNAAEILFTGRLFDAQQAQAYGLLNGVVDGQVLDSHVNAIAAEIAGNAPLPLSQIKKGLQMAPHKSLEQMFDYDAKMQALCLKTADIREGIAAAREKRAPAFRGK